MTKLFWLRENHKIRTKSITIKRGNLHQISQKSKQPSKECKESNEKLSQNSLRLPSQMIKAESSITAKAEKYIKTISNGYNNALFCLMTREQTLFRVCCTTLYKLRETFQEKNYEYSKDEVIASRIWSTWPQQPLFVEKSQRKQ